MTFAAVTEPKIIDEAAKQNQHSTGWVGPSAKRQIYDDEAPKGLLTPHRRYGGKRMYEDTSKGDSYDDTKKRDVEDSSDTYKRITKKAISDKQPQLIMAGLPGPGLPVIPQRFVSPGLSRGSGRLIRTINTADRHKATKKREAKQNTNGSNGQAGLMQTGPPGLQRDSRGFQYIPIGLVSPGSGGGVERLIKTINIADRHKDTKKREAKQNTIGYAGLMKTGPPGLQRDSRGFQYIQKGLVSPGSGGGVERLIKTINIADRHKDTKKREAEESSNSHQSIVKKVTLGKLQNDHDKDLIFRGPVEGRGNGRLIKTINTADKRRDTKKREAIENTNGDASLLKKGLPGLQRDSRGFHYIQKGLVSPGSGRAGRLIKTINIADRHKDARKREAEESSSSHQNNAKKATLSNLQGGHDKGRITRSYVGGRGGKRLVTDVKNKESNGDTEKREAKENSGGYAGLSRKVRLANTEKREAKENGDETMKVL